MSCCWCTLVIVGIITYIVIKFIKKKDRPPIIGIYKQKGKWYPIKYLLFLLIIKFRRLKQKLKSNDEIQSDGKPCLSIEKMERPQPLSDHPLGFEAIFFIGADHQGYKFTLGMERRKHGLFHCVLYFLTPDDIKLHLPCVPDSFLFSSKNGEESQSFEADCIKVELIKPLRKWKLTYKGPMMDEKNNVHYLDFEGEWSSENKHFLFETDCLASTLAEAIGREDWSQEYFDNLKMAHQTHYEQMGVFKGHATIQNGSGSTTEHTLNLQSFRDHSYGYKRDWSLMHRYAFFILFFKDGSSLSLGIICQPCTSTTLKIGYRCTAKGKYIPISWCDFELYQHGEGGEPPKDHSFEFKAGGKLYTLQIVVQYESAHYVGLNWKAKMVERFVNCTLNGVRGYGVSEFHYRNDNGRPEKYSANDPIWFKKITDVQQKTKKNI